MPFRCCLVTDRARLGPGWAAALPELVARAAAAGVDLVQVRERGLEARELGALVARCRRAIDGSGTRLLVSDRLDIALAEGAHGVHLPSGGLTPAEVRMHAAPGFLIGRSVHSVAEAARVTADGGADFLVFGTVFPSHSKLGIEPAGLAQVAATVAATHLPVLAIGGIAEATLGGVAGTGAAGVAAIGFLTVESVEEMRRRVRLVRKAFDTLSPQVP